MADRVERANRRPSAKPSASEPPRAKSLSPRDPAVRALEKYASAVAAYEGACEDRSGLGRIDESYAALANAAAAVVVAARGATWLSPELRAMTVAHADQPEDDVRLADLALHELNSGRRSSS